MNFNFNLKRIYAWPLALRMVMFGLIFIFIIYIGNVWLVSDLQSDLKSAQQQENKLKQQLAIDIDKEATLHQELISLPSAQKLLAQMQTKLVRYGDITELLNQILKIGANNNLYFNLFDPGEDTTVGNYHKLPIKIITTGTYHQIGDFLSQVANLQWIVVIGNLTISSNLNDEKTGAVSAPVKNPDLLTAEIHLDIYRLPEKNELPGQQVKPETKALPLKPMFDAENKSAPP